MTQGTALAIVGTTIALGLLLLGGLVIPLRTESYRHWSRPASWLFIGVVILVAGFGAVLWIMLWWTRGGWPAGVAQFLILAVGFKQFLMALPGPSASSATSPPPPAF